MHPFRNKNSKHSIRNENKDSQKEKSHPFVRSNPLFMDKDSTPCQTIRIQQIPIVNVETLEQVIQEINLMRNKN